MISYFRQKRHSSHIAFLGQESAFWCYCGIQTGSPKTGTMYSVKCFLLFWRKQYRQVMFDWRFLSAPPVDACRKDSEKESRTDRLRRDKILVFVKDSWMTRGTTKKTTQINGCHFQTLRVTVHSKHILNIALKAKRVIYYWAGEHSGWGSLT